MKTTPHSDTVRDRDTDSAPGLPVETWQTGVEGVEQAAVRFRLGATSKALVPEAVVCGTRTLEHLTDAFGRCHSRLRKWLKHSKADSFLVVIVFRPEFTHEGQIREACEAAISNASGPQSFVDAGNSSIIVAIFRDAADPSAKSWLTNRLHSLHLWPVPRPISDDTQKSLTPIQEIKSLADATIYIPANSEIERLHNLISHVQENVPSNDAEKQQLVDSVNRWLEACGYRIRLPTGKLARLCVQKGGSGKPAILFEIIGHGATGGFRDTPFQLVPYQRGDAARVFRTARAKRSRQR